MKKLILCSMFAALTAVLSQIALPIGPVPINLALIAVFAAGGILGWKGGAISQIIVLLMGIVGLPVFSAFRSGIGTLLGPTGGFIIGYIPCAIISGKLKNLPLAMTSGLFIVYTTGLSWYMHITGARLWDAALICVFPFIIGDSIKIIISSILAKRVRRSYK